MSVISLITRAQANGFRFNKLEIAISEAVTNQTTVSTIKYADKVGLDSEGIPTS